MSELKTSNAQLWAKLQSLTPARVGIRSVDGALPTPALLTLQEDHARARDAVFRGIDLDALEGAIRPRRAVIKVQSAARDRITYIRFPTLGRCLAAESRARLTADRAEQPWDVTFVIADGLSGDAVMQNAVPTLLQCLALLNGWRVSPIVLAAQGRVALGDEIATLLNARLCVMLIGERPGLTVSSSLGAYITWAPYVGCHDALRNCVSNIHPDGLTSESAARTICWLLEEARRRGHSGTALKDDRSVRTVAHSRAAALGKPAGPGG